MNEQPTIVNVSAEVTIGAPSGLTLVLEGTACTVPPCGHIMTDDAFSRPGMAQETSNAPLLMLTPLLPISTL